MKQFLHASVVVLGIVNIILFGVWLSIIRISALSGAAAKDTYYFDQISFQVTMLETAIAFIGIMLAVLGFFGYQHTVERAEMRADKAARDVVMQLHKDGRLTSNIPGTSLPVSGLPTAGSVPINNLQKEGDV